MGAEPTGTGGAASRDGRWLEAWLAEAVLARDLRPATRAAYARDGALLLGFLHDRGTSTDRATPDDLVAFLASRSRAGDGRRTRARRLAAMKGLFGWLKETGRLARDPTRLLPASRRESLLPKGLSEAEVAALLAGGDRPDDPLALRDHAVIEVLYGAGLRASEVAGLRLADLDPDGALLRVAGKGRKERRVPLGGPAMAATLTWIRRGRARLAGPRSGDALFLSARGRPLGRDAVYRLVKRRARRCGLVPTVSPHTLRHTYATHLVKGGADLRAVQELLGHASIDTTQVYTTLARDHLKATHRRFHPRP